MPTKKPRITITLNPHVYETLRRLGELQGRPPGKFVSEMLEDIHAPLMRTVALLDAAKDAPEQVKEGLRAVVESVEQEFSRAADAQAAQVDWILAQSKGAQAEAAERPAAPRKGARKGSNPRIVTRGSGRKSRGSKGGK